MNIPFHVDPNDVTADGMLVSVRCTDKQAALLARTLRAQYPAARPRLLPLFDNQQYTHCCRVPDSESELRRRWPAIQFQMLLAGSDQPARAPAHADRPVAKRRVAQGHETGTVALPIDLSPTLSPALLPIADTSEAPQLVQAAAPDHAAEVEAFSARRSPAAGAGAPAVAPGTHDQWDPPVVVEPPDPRLAHLDQLLAAGELEAVVRQVAPDEPIAAVRGRLGTALARLGAPADARGHLLVAWQQHAVNAAVALELGRIHWQEGDYDMAALTYKMLIDDPPDALELRDYAAIAELASSGEFGEIAIEPQVFYIERFFSAAGVREMHEPHVDSLAQRGLVVARQLGANKHVCRAYQHMMDVLLARRAGQGIRDLLDQMRHDYWQQLLTARDRFDLMDELTGYLQDYPLLREPLGEGYEELLRQEIDAARERGAFSEYARDLYRTWRKLAHRGGLGDEYRRLVIELRATEQEAIADGDTDLAAAALLAGKRIALVGGHGRTREHVRARLEGWGVRVAEVAPPTNGRIKERDISDRIRSSDLILLIVGYMGHDMSTVVNNLVRRDALLGTVLPVECRGTSGICRAIIRWVASA